MKKLNFKNKSKANIKRLKKYYRRNQPSAYKSEMQEYENVQNEISDLASDLNKISAGYGKKLLKQAQQQQKVLTDAKSFVAQEMQKEKAKLPKNREKSAEYLKTVRFSLANLTLKPQYSPSNLKNYITTIAAKAAGIDTKRANRTGQIKPDYTTATKEQKKKYEKARRFLKSGKADVILRAMGAYEKSHGINGIVANSDQVMENIAEYVQEHPDSEVDEIVKEVYAKIN